jgi:hypothetical protein
MAAWSDVGEDAPDFARRVRDRFGAGTSKTIAALRRDGSPRISAVEMQFSGGEVTFGMMAGSRKLAGVRRDPRIAVHCPAIEPLMGDPPGWAGDAKLAGTAIATGPVQGRLKETPSAWTSPEPCPRIWARQPITW